MSASVEQTVMLTISVKIPIKADGVTADEALERVSRKFDYGAGEFSDIVEFFNARGIDPTFSFHLP